MGANTQGVEQSAARRRRVVVLGSTGSIGTNCLDVVDHLEHRLEIFGLSAHTSWKLLWEQMGRWRPRFVTVTDEKTALRVQEERLPAGTRLLHGVDGIAAMVRDPDV